MERSGEDVWVAKGKQGATFEPCAPEDPHLLPLQSVVAVLVLAEVMELKELVRARGAGVWKVVQFAALHAKWAKLAPPVERLHCIRGRRRKLGHHIHLGYFSPRRQCRGQNWSYCC